jgi:hypothetical protein
VLNFYVTQEFECSLILQHKEEAAMSKSVIAIQGETSEKIVDGKVRKVIPFVGSDSEGEFSQLGIGFLYPESNSGCIWGLVMPHHIIQSWRGMKILENVKEIGHGTLAECWYAGDENLSDSDKRYLDELAVQFSSREEFDTIRAEILGTAPSPEEIESMIHNLREKDVGIDSWELEKEIKAGRITSSSTINDLIAETQRKLETYQREMEEVNKPLPHEESLSAFFQDLGIDNFIIGGGIGGYGLDWSHVEIEELDRIAKQDSFSKYLPNGHRLERTIGSPRDENFGEIEQPHFTAKDGTTYKFISAKYHDDHFFIKVFVDKPEVAPYTGEFTIQQLRSMIGEIPSPRKKSKFFREFLEFLKYKWSSLP